MEEDQKNDRNSNTGTNKENVTLDVFHDVTDVEFGLRSLMVTGRCLGTHHGTMAAFIPFTFTLIY